MSSSKHKHSSAFEEDIHNFLAFLELEKGLSKNTVEAYERDLHQCTQFLANQHISDWRGVKKHHISLWIAELNHNQLSPKTISRKLSALRMLAKHLVLENRRQDNFMELLSSPKVVRKLPGTLTIAQIGKLLDAPSKISAHGLRDRAFLELMYSSGLRVSELCHLTLQSIDLEYNFLRVHGKGSKERIVPLGSQANQAIKHYLIKGRPQLVKQQTGSELFVSQ